MNRKVIQLTVILISFIFIIFLITSSNTVLESINFSISIWKDNLFPTLFPFFVVSNILIQYGFVDIIGSVLSTPMQKIFKLPGSSSFALISSLFSGFPSGAKYTTTLVKENKLTTTDAARLLTFTHYSNPLFIIGFIGGILLNKKIAYLILISHILGGLLVGKLFSFNIKNNLEKEEKKIKKEDKNKYPSFGKSLSNSIMDSLNTMFLLLGVVTIFTLITALIQTLFNLPPLYTAILSGILEMTQGVKNITMLEISDYLKTVLTTFFISFGGFSVHMQVASIITDANIKYKSFFLARVLHALISSGLVSILFHYFIN